MRKFILSIFFVISLGAGLELILLDHIEDIWQWIPLIVMGISFPLILSIHFEWIAGLEKIFGILMYISAASAALGLFFHLKANFEFEQEMYPALGKLELFLKSLKGATPSLAPGTMLAIGMIGILYLRVYKQEKKIKTL